MVWTDLHSKLHKTLKQRSLLPQGAKILIAVSGGQDSVCLTQLLLDLQPKWHWQLAIAHCDHGWSTDVGIADHVRDLARNWQLPFYLKIAHQLKETEAAAREWRYQRLIEIATEQGFSIVVTGHTQSDRAETFLYNLIRGAGSDGLQALTWQRALTCDIQLIRPLLNISRSETGDFCQQFQLPIWEDAFNDKLHYARNRIRQQLLPYLKTEFNPQVETAIAQTAELLQADVHYLETLSENILWEIVNPEANQLNRVKLRILPLALQRRIIRQFLKHNLETSPNYEQIEEVVQLIIAPNRSRTSTFPKNYFVEAQGEWLVIAQKSN
ncbi:MAG: tRNA lysidine(34) synthetase TilS [Snowella sp.]|nr:tRNA lysidine(34) synthetase TilS [Snowella sp.]